MALTAKRKSFLRRQRITKAQREARSRKLISGHLDRIFPDLDPKKCPECGRVDFKSERGMQQHRNRAHARPSADGTLPEGWTMAGAING